jgi:uncharacterized protein YyaL (SSP411 family)
MPYDQALLAEVYADAFATTEKPEFKRTAVEVVEYVLRDLASPEGGFFTAEDADSEGEEGKFYLWSRDELNEALGPEEADLAARVFSVSAEGNFAEPGKSRDGRLALGPSREVVVVGKREAPDTQGLLTALRESYLPNTVTLFKPTDDPKSALRIERLAPFTKDMGGVDGRAAAYVCSGGRCLRPVTAVAELLDSIR